MGNIFGKDPNTLNFKGIHTEQFSDNIPYLERLQVSSEKLAELSNNQNNESQNKLMYEMFNDQNNSSDNLIFSDTSPLLTEGDINSNTSEITTEISKILNKINVNNTGGVEDQSGGGSEIFINDPNATFERNIFEDNTQFVNQQMFQNMFTESGQTGGGDVNFIDDGMLKSLFTESYLNQKGGNGNNVENQQSETFINQQTYNMMNKKELGNETSVNNTEFNDYMKNAITELTSTLEGYNNDQKGGDMDSSEMFDNSSTVTDNNSPNQPVEDEEEGSEQGSEVSQSLNNADAIGNLESSSAHTDGVDSDALTTMSDNSEANEKYLSDSINTSDINMISVE